MHIYKKSTLTLTLITIITLSGCASVTGSKYQSLSVETKQKNGDDVSEASCKLNNDKGAWYLKTPGTTTVHKSNEALHIKCEIEAFDPGTATVESAAGGAVWGNILIGGGIGWLIDHSSGSAYDYPPVIQIMMGEHMELKPKRINPQDSEE